MMSRTSIFEILGACIIAGCTQQQAPATVQTTAALAQATPSETATPASAAAAGMANPASVNCGKIGGTTEIKTAADGSQYGMCTFTNGTTCEEWALFRNEGCKPGVSSNTTTTGVTGMANPASVNCGKVGGTTEIKTAADGSQYGMCTFTNGTTCEEWALFRGEGCTPYVAAATTTASK
jgi:putative hemolysin